MGPQGHWIFFHRLLSVLIVFFLDIGITDDVVGFQSSSRLQHQTASDDFFDLGRITLRKRLVLPFYDVCFQLRHISPCEWMTKSDHFIKKTPKRPKIGLSGVRLLQPYLRTCVERSTDLCFSHSITSNRTDIHIAQLHFSIVTDKIIGSFHITMYDIGLV